MKRNKLLSLLLVLIMCVSLCACGGGSESTETQETNQDVSADGVVYAEDIFSFEAVGYEDFGDAYTVNIDFKFRNISETDYDSVVFYADALDYNGDVIESTIIGADNVSAGKAIWYSFQTNDSRASKTIEELSEKIHSVEVYSAQIQEDIADPNTYKDIDFKEPIVITVAEVKHKDLVSDAQANDNILDLAVSKSWVRADNSATLKFNDEKTGIMELDDGEYYEFEWNIGDNNTLDIILNIDGEEAPATYNFSNENGIYCIQMIDNADFTYYAQ